MDYYGPRVPLGGGAIYGKDPTHVDRFGARKARWPCVNSSSPTVARSCGSCAILRCSSLESGPRIDDHLTASYHWLMETTKLSSKGQVVLPKSVREQHGWAPGTEFVVESTPDGVRLRARTQFPQTELGQVFGSVPHAGPAKTIEEMDAGVRTAVARQYRRAVKR